MAILFFAKLSPAQFQLSFSLAGLRLVLFLHNTATNPATQPPTPTRENIIQVILEVHMSAMTV